MYFDSVAYYKYYKMTEEKTVDDAFIRNVREIMIEILHLYKNFPCLWDISNHMYKNEQARHNALEILLEKWKLIDKNITLEKTAFLRERKRYVCMYGLTKFNNS